MIVVDILSALTLAADILLILYIPFLLLRNQLRTIWAFFDRYRLELSFLVALTAMSGSLYFSQIAHYQPCELCWFQRIFMYPQVIVLGAALIAKAKDYARYVLPLSVIGASISAYHYITSMLAVSTICSATGPSCNAFYFESFGYITIPMMALTAFLTIIALNVLPKAKK